ncbi:helix-turn-helix domain-containing protein [Aeromicrobium marinum]|nr:helix-turn-helix domain-containing protein [Aeromicrobium marinum]
MNTFHAAAEAVAGEVRAEMARQRKTQAELATILGTTTATAGRRLDGSVPFDVVELCMVAGWLGTSPDRFTATLPTVAAS